MHRLILLLLASVVVAQLSEECQYVSSNRFLNDTGKVQQCFENSSRVDQVVVDAIIRNLELIHDIYPYTDIAQNPPSEPEGYFKKMNFTKGLEDLKIELSGANLTVASVFRPTMKFIDGFRDGHFSMNVYRIKNEYDNLFSDVSGVIPFEWEVLGTPADYHVFIHSPDSDFLSQEACETIDRLYAEGVSVASVDGRDAFDFFADFFGDFNPMKSPQGRLILAKSMQTFYVLSYPLDNLFDSHMMIFSNGTELEFHVGFLNWRVSAQNARSAHHVPKDLFHPRTMQQEEEIRFMIRNFQKRSVRSKHYIVICDKLKFATNDMNYMQIRSFDFFGYYAELFLQELEECVSDFDENKAPITLILPFNEGGSAELLVTVLFLLMPHTDYRQIDAIRKSKAIEEMAPYIVEGLKLSNNEACNMMKTTAEFEDFWDVTEVDDLGNGVTHKRTKKVTEGYKDEMRSLLNYRMSKNIRKPTDIIVATDGYCFSACATLVDSIIRSGSAIVAGFGTTSPGDELFAAGQCPSVVISTDSFTGFQNNSQLGLSFSAAVVESYDFSAKMDEVIPLDYCIYPIDVHSGYYYEYDPSSSSHRGSLLAHTLDVHERFKDKCNAKNKRLLFVTDECNTKKSNAVLYGYACGDDGEWNRSACKVAACEDGYVVDFENDKCVENPCFPTETEPSSKSESEPIVESSASSAVSSLMVIVATTLLSLLLVVF